MAKKSGSAELVVSKADRRVYVHVGAPKTGTTFLQASPAQHREALLQAGVCYPGGDERMFRAALDVRGTHKAWGRKRSEVEDRWGDLCRLARKHHGTTVISHELLGAAPPRRVAAALSLLEGIDVHIVVTARDPAQHAVAEWQEGIKHGRRLTFEDFRVRVLAADADGKYARGYRASHDLPAVLARWGERLPPENVHVVCTPPGPVARTLLWQRFAEAVGFDAEPLEPAGPDAQNASLGVDEIDLLRRVNVALDKRLVQPEYGRVVKQGYARYLLQVGCSAPPVVLAEMYDDLMALAERWVKEIDTAGYTLHGSLAELIPVEPLGRTAHPDVVDSRAQVDAAVASTAELLVDLQRTRNRAALLEAENRDLRKQHKQHKRGQRRATSG